MNIPQLAARLGDPTIAGLASALKAGTLPPVVSTEARRDSTARGLIPATAARAVAKARQAEARVPRLGHAHEP